MTKVSVIIPTYNEEKVILDCLNSLSKQSITDFEVIIVDDGSSDSTLSRISNLQFSIANLQILKQEHKGPGQGRNLGAKHAKGDVLVFVDADMTFDRRFLKMLIAPIVAGKSKGTFSSDETVSNWHNVWARCWNINEGWEPRRRHPRDYPNHQPVFRAIRRSEFLKVGGFTPGGYDDDWSLSKKLGYEADKAEHAIFFHKNPESLGEVFIHAQWTGKREYKFGQLGRLLALVRVSLPVSLVVGLLKSIVTFNFYFLTFKLVFDLGVFVGIIKYMFTKKGAK